MSLDDLLKTLVMDLGHLRLIADLHQALPASDRETLRQAQQLIAQVRRRANPFTSGLQVG